MFPTLCNTLHSKNSKYTICDIDYKRDVSMCMEIWKQIIKKMMREKNVNNEEHLKYLLRHFAVYFKLPLLKNTSQQYK